MPGLVLVGRLDRFVRGPRAGEAELYSDMDLACRSNNPVGITSDSYGMFHQDCLLQPSFVSPMTWLGVFMSDPGMHCTAAAHEAHNAAAGRKRIS
jgi:hypothetical protein